MRSSFLHLPFTSTLKTFSPEACFKRLQSAFIQPVLMKVLTQSGCKQHKYSTLKKLLGTFPAARQSHSELKSTCYVGWFRQCNFQRAGYCSAYTLHLYTVKIIKSEPPPSILRTAQFCSIPLSIQNNTKTVA